MMQRAPRWCCHVHNVIQNSKWLIGAVRGMPTMIIPGFTLRHARTVASCAFSSVKSNVPSNKATLRKGRVVPTLLTSRFSCCILDWGLRFGYISSIFLSMGRRTRRGTDFVGWESSTMQLKNPSGMLKDSVTCSPDSTFCLDASPRVVIWFSGRCPVSKINWRQTSWSTSFSCSCTFRGAVSRRHPRSSPGPQVEHRTRPS